MKVGEIGSSDFDAQVLKAEGLVIVDFWAPWCGPCKAIAPTLETLAEEFEGNVTIFKVNVDDHPQVASSYDVKSIPNLVFFKGGEVVDRMVGASEKEPLVGKINEHK